MSPESLNGSALHVLIDATAIPANRGGVGRYVDGLVAGLAAADSQTRVTVVTQALDASAFAHLPVTVVAAPGMIARTPARLAWEQWGLPRLARRLGVDVLHSPHYTFPLAWRGGQVVTIHDMTFFSHPQVHSRLKRAFFTWWIRLLARKRVNVVSVSQATADEYVKWAGASAQTITVTGLGVDPEVFHQPTSSQVAAVAQALGTDQWIAFLATLEPRKNVPALVEAYSRVAQARLPETTPPLVLAGGRGWDERVGPAVEAAQARGADVRIAGYLPIESLAGFLGGSVLFAYPSLGEGFGLPVLEAMACGASVLTTRELSLPEVGGDAVAYCAVDVESIERGLAQLLADARERAALSERATMRATQFTWETVASRHVEAYEASRDA